VIGEVKRMRNLFYILILDIFSMSTLKREFKKNQDLYFTKTVANFDYIFILNKLFAKQLFVIFIQQRVKLA